MSQTNDTPQTPANGLYVGEIRFFPFRPEDLPFGWYFCNGERYEFATPQGEVLKTLPENFRADWGLEEDVCSISLPKLFSEDGRGCFLRAVDGAARRVGTAEGDAIRNIVGDLFSAGDPNNQHLMGFLYGIAQTDFGALYINKQKAGTAYIEGTIGGTTGSIGFDASRVVPTAEENRPLNMGMTPAIYLGV